jgi:DNA processing protein
MGLPLAKMAIVCYLPHLFWAVSGVSMEEREAYIALNMMGKVGPVTVRSLVTELGSAAAIFSADRDTLGRVGGVGREAREALLAGREAVDWQAEMDRAEREGVRLVAAVDAEYPRSLLEIHDPPLALYVKGRIDSRDRQAIAVVGTRHPTHYGRDCAGRLAGQLAQAGFCVVSGLALGIDTAAHEAALGAGGRTLAVVAGGLDCLYPESNRGLAERVAGHGAIVSEYPFGRNPDKTTFPVRNRIVSGLSMGVLVVEAGFRSGALITADQATEQGRSVFAVPGRIDSAASQGAHLLLKQGARLVENVDDVLREFEFLFPSAKMEATAARRERPILTPAEEQLLKVLQEGEADVDTLIRTSGLNASAVGSLLIGLEMKRLVRMLPGRMVELVTNLS